MTTEPTKTFIDEYGYKTEEWRDNEGRLHRDGKPALIAYRENGNIYSEIYYQHGKEHRDNAPARITYNQDGNISREAYYRDGTTRSEYWRDGTSYTPGVRDVKNTLQEKLEKLEEKRKQLNARIQRIRAKYAAKERKARTRRLIQVGAILESNLGIEFTEEKRNQLARFLHHKYDNGITGAQRVLEQISRESAEPIS